MGSTSDLIRSLPGPLLVVGASGFVGANLLRRLLKVRQDVTGTFHANTPWRLEGVQASRLQYLDLISPVSLASLMARVRPAVVFNCAAYGAYSFEQNSQLIHQTNYITTLDLLALCEKHEVKAYIHAGSSSEYGLNCASPSEDAPLLPDSHYAVSKAGAAQAITYYGKIRGLPCLNLRLYSLYGPYEDASRLFPVLSEHLNRGVLPPLVDPETSRDFTYIDDAVEAFVVTAARLSQAHYGESFNVGTGVKTTLRELVEVAREAFHIKEPPKFNSLPQRDWDRQDWRADPARIREVFGWQAKTALADGLRASVAWWRDFLPGRGLAGLTKKRTVSSKNSVSAIVACYKDGQAIPIMYERLSQVFRGLNLDYEIIFVNDASPDDSSQIIRQLSEQDPRVLGIVHSRNFGSQAAFRSGMEVASKEACVLLDGDLQDPPELVAAFVEKWRGGADVVYGRRVKREMPGWLEMLYRGFYRVFSAVSEVPIPTDAGDFSLIDGQVMHWLLACKERDSFLRGLRAYVGFTQEGVDYVRPERVFGRSTNNLFKNVGWAKKAIFSFSRLPLHLLTLLGFFSTAGSILLLLLIFLGKVLNPDLIPQGLTTVVMLQLLFGSSNLLALGILGEYLGKIIEEVKQRPSFIRHQRIEHGAISIWKDAK